MAKDNDESHATASRVEPLVMLAAPSSERGAAQATFVECKQSKAICATCSECDWFGDNNVTFMSIKQKVFFHRKYTGHKKITYWTIEPKQAAQNLEAA